MTLRLELALGLLAALLLAGIAVGLLVARARRARRSLAPRRPRTEGPRFPVVLAHGLMGFDFIQVAGQKTEYFRGVPDRLRERGAEVHVARVPAFAGIPKRAEAFAAFVKQLEAPKVNVVAHSLGGLDARYAIAKLGLAERVACLVTVGTPHEGTPLVNVGAGLRRSLQKIGLDFAALHDIGPERMRVFNEEIRDVAGVTYACFEATIPRRGPHPLLWPAHLYLSKRAGPNDGMVPVSSQRWGAVWGQIRADHWAEIGWAGGFDAPAFYEEIARELKTRGF